MTDTGATALSEAVTNDNKKLAFWLVKKGAKMYFEHEK